VRDTLWWHGHCGVSWVGSFRADAGEAERSLGGDGERDCEVLQGAGGYGSVDAAYGERKTMSAEYAWSMKTAMNKYLASFFFVCLGVLSRADAGPADVGREVVVNVGYENSDYRVKISAHGDSVTVEKSGAAAPTANLPAASPEAIRIALGRIQESTDGIPGNGSVDGSAETVICIDAIATAVDGVFGELVWSRPPGFRNYAVVSSPGSLSDKVRLLASDISTKIQSMLDSWPTNGAGPDPLQLIAALYEISEKSFALDALRSQISAKAWQN